MNELPKDRPDDLDRVQANVLDKLRMICDNAKETFGEDPRGMPGKYSFVAQPRVIAQIWEEMPIIVRDLQRAIVYGRDDADIVMFWNKIPFIVRLNVKQDLGLVIMKNKKIPESTSQDRMVAGNMRMRAVRGQNMIEGGGLVS